MPDPFIGRMVGDYELKSLLGQGGMAIVYLGRDSNLQRDVAVKIVSKLIAQDPTFLERFNREVALAARLQHPHIVPVFDFGTTDDGLTYLAMRHIQGGSLSDRLRLGPLTMGQARKWFVQIAEALEYAHNQGIIHRDLKPSNILIDDSGNAYLVDFGLARMIDLNDGRVPTQLTKSSTFMGTPMYMSPEQIEQRPLDTRSDLYSLGVVLWEMVVGKPPYSSESTFRIMQMHLTEQPQSPQKLRASINPELAAMLLKTIEKTPGRRFQSAREMIEAFDASVSRFSTGTNTEILSRTRTTARLRYALTEAFAGRNRRLAGILAGVIGLALLALIFLPVAFRGGQVVATSVPTATVPIQAATNLLSLKRPKTGTLKDIELTADQARRAKELFTGSFLGVVACQLNSDYHASLASASRSRAEELGIPVKLENSETKSGKQAVIMNQFMALGARAIALCLLNYDSTIEVRQRAGAANIPVALNDERLTPGGVSFTVSNEDMGNAAGEFAARYIKQNMGGQANVIVLNYPSLTQVKEREDKMVAVLQANAPNVKILGAYLGGLEDNGEKAMRQALQEHPELNFIMSINDAGSLGAVRVLREVGKKPDEISIVSIDAVEEARRLIKSGEYFRGSVNTSPTTVGRASVDGVIKLMFGDPIPETIVLPLEIITKENAGS